MCVCVCVCVCVCACVLCIYMLKTSQVQCPIIFLTLTHCCRGAYALSVAWHGRLVHHLLTLNPATGFFELNNKPCGTCTTLPDVIDHLKLPHPSLAWRSCLTDWPRQGVHQQPPA